MISNLSTTASTGPYNEFQSPMGISMISNSEGAYLPGIDNIVSIPNGDKHDFKLGIELAAAGDGMVSIPNGDKHDFKR